VYAFPGGFFRYEGDWVKGKMHGAGVFALGDGATYEGNFIDGEINGVGLKRWPDGSTYSGSFRDGEMDGDGVFLSSTGERYDGQWRDNQRCGSGELEFINEDVYRGEFRAHKPDGRGKIEYAATGRAYDGEWCAGVRSGEGVLYDGSGTRLYEGSWSGDQRHGQGVGALDVTVTAGLETSPTALWYEGIWENDQPNGTLDGPNQFKQCLTTSPGLCCIALDRTTRLAVMLLSQDGGELIDKPLILPVENKQIPPIAVVCCGKREAIDGRLARVVGESKRRIVLKIFEGQPPSQSPATAEPVSANGGASAREGEAPSPQWQFVLSDPSAEQELQPKGDVESNGVHPNESGQAEDGDDTPQLPDERRVDEVEGECNEGMVVFRDLRLPVATLAGTYHLVCESHTSDALEAVHVPLMVVAEGATGSSGNQVQGKK
jgi:hypothetical protein